MLYRKPSRTIDRPGSSRKFLVVIIFSTRDARCDGFWVCGKHWLSYFAFDGSQAISRDRDLEFVSTVPRGEWLPSCCRVASACSSSISRSSSSSSRNILSCIQTSSTARVTIHNGVPKQASKYPKPNQLHPPQPSPTKRNNSPIQTSNLIQSPKFHLPRAASLTMEIKKTPPVNRPRVTDRPTDQPARRLNRSLLRALHTLKPLLSSHRRWPDPLIASYRITSHQIVPYHAA